LTSCKYCGDESSTKSKIWEPVCFECKDLLVNKKLKFNSQNSLYLIKEYADRLKNYEHYFQPEVVKKLKCVVESYEKFLLIEIDEKENELSETEEQKVLPEFEEPEDEFFDFFELMKNDKISLHDLDCISRFDLEFNINKVKNFPIIEEKYCIEKPRLISEIKKLLSKNAVTFGRIRSVIRQTCNPLVAKLDEEHFIVLLSVDKEIPVSDRKDILAQWGKLSREPRPQPTPSKPAPSPRAPVPKPQKSNPWPAPTFNHPTGYDHFQKEVEQYDKKRPSDRKGETLNAPTSKDISLENPFLEPDKRPGGGHSKRSYDINHEQLKRELRDFKKKIMKESHQSDESYSFDLISEASAGRMLSRTERSYLWGCYQSKIQSRVTFPEIDKLLLPIFANDPTYGTLESPYVMLRRWAPVADKVKALTKKYKVDSPKSDTALFKLKNEWFKTLSSKEISEIENLLQSIRAFGENLDALFKENQ
jgi:hypothetical protein